MIFRPIFPSQGKLGKVSFGRQLEQLLLSFSLSRHRQSNFPRNWWQPTLVNCDVFAEK